MLQRFIQRAKELAKKNDKGGQWQVIAVGTHGEFANDLGDPPSFYEGITWPDLQKPIPDSAMRVYLKETHKDDES